MLLTDSQERIYVAQSGLIGDGLPTHKTLFQLPAGELRLKDGENAVELRLQAPEHNGVQVTKVMRFARGSYLLKGTRLHPETVVGACSVVGRAFEEGHCVVAGVPAKIVKRGIRWDRDLI